MEPVSRRVEAVYLGPAAPPVAEAPAPAAPAAKRRITVVTVGTQDAAPADPPPLVMGATAKAAASAARLTELLNRNEARKNRMMADVERRATMFGAVLTSAPLPRGADADEEDYANFLEAYGLYVEELAHRQRLVAGFDTDDADAPRYTAEEWWALVKSLSGPEEDVSDESSAESSAESEEEEAEARTLPDDDPPAILARRVKDRACAQSNPARPFLIAPDLHELTDREDSDDDMEVDTGRFPSTVATAREFLDLRARPGVGRT